MSDAKVDPALANLLDYFDALGRADFETAVGCFSEDGEYYHPDYGTAFPDRVSDGSGEAHFVKGRAGLLELLQLRGAQPTQHFVTAFARTGNHCFSEGHFTFAGEPRGSWVLSFSVDDHNRLRRYIPYSAIPPQPLVADRPLSKE